MGAERSPAPRGWRTVGVLALASTVGLAQASEPASEQMGREVGAMIQATCGGQRPMSVAVDSFGTLPGWFEQSAWSRALMASLPAGSQVGLDANRYFNSTASEQAARQDALSLVFGGLILVELQPANERVDASLSGACFPSAGETRPIEVAIVSGKRLEKPPGQGATERPRDGDAPPSVGIEWVSLGAFEISKTEVTVAQYRACVEAGVCTEPGQGDYCNNWGDSSREVHPINCVNWKQATIFAGWAGGRLPTGEEWTYAATSGGESWKYPWGDETPTCARAIMFEGSDGCSEDQTWPVCSKPAGHSSQGVCDLAGNVREWTDEGEGSSYREYRGGSWGSGASRLRASYRNGFGPSRRSPYIGFRIAR